MILLSMVFISFLLISFFIPTLLSKLSDFKKVEGTFSHAEVIIYKERQYKVRYRGHELVDVPRLTIFLLDSDRTYTLGKADYEKYFSSIERKSNSGAKIRLHLRNIGNESINPMQIEINGEIILPLSHQKRIAVYSTIGSIVLFLIGILLLAKYFRKYKTHYYRDDRKYWNKGFTKKLGVIGKWVGI